MPRASRPHAVFARLGGDRLAVTTGAQDRAMTVDYHQFINRDLPPRERGCTSKAMFLSRREARSISRQPWASSGLKPYRCRWCDGWHLGHGRRSAFGPAGRLE